MKAFVKATSAPRKAPQDSETISVLDRIRHYEDIENDLPFTN